VTSPDRSQPLPFIGVRLEEGVATLSISRPQAGNALNWPLLEQLRHAFGQAAESPRVQAIVITANGGRFSTGADVGYLVRCLELNDVPRAINYIRASQEVFAEMAECLKPVVAAVQGAAVGGGFELALACHCIVASPRASFSFPETALGILPSSGGTYRTPARIGVELAKWLVCTGYVVPPPMALRMGLIDRLAMPDQLFSVATSLALELCATQAHRRPRTVVPAAEFEVLRSLFGRARVAELLGCPLPDDRIVASALAALAARPRWALERAEHLIDAAPSQSPADAAGAALAAAATLLAEPGVRPALVRAAQQQKNR
jgi:enoyl-CoA hydratase/carnithine racemase